MSKIRVFNAKTKQIEEVTKLKLKYLKKSPHNVYKELTPELEAELMKRQEAKDAPIVNMKEAKKDVADMSLTELREKYQKKYPEVTSNSADGFRAKIKAAKAAKKEAKKAKKAAESSEQPVAKNPVDELPVKENVDPAQTQIPVEKSTEDEVAKDTVQSESEVDNNDPAN